MYSFLGFKVFIRPCGTYKGGMFASFQVAMPKCVLFTVKYVIILFLNEKFINQVAFYLTHLDTDKRFYIEILYFVLCVIITYILPLFCILSASTAVKQKPLKSSTKTRKTYRLLPHNNESDQVIFTTTTKFEF